MSGRIVTLVCRLLGAAAIVILGGGALAAPANLTCKGRALASAGKSDAIDPEQLLDAAMKGKRFAYSEAASLAGTEAMLIQYYGMRQSLRAIPGTAERKAVARISHLMQNDYVIAGQMALGAQLLRNSIPPVILRPLASYVTNSTEPYHGDDELTSLNEQIRRGTEIAAPISEKPRAFARWVMRAAAFDDAVALDAAMGGFCLVNPTANDLKLLRKGYQVARLDRSRPHKDPALHSGAEPSLSLLPPR